MADHVGRLPGRLITTAGYGEEAPAESNDTPDGQAQNRRVVITATPQS